MKISFLDSHHVDYHYLMLVLIVIILVLIQSFNFINYVNINNKQFKVELADTAKERQKGLMYRDELCDDCGMLFKVNKNSFNKNIIGSKIEFN